VTVAKGRIALKPFAVAIVSATPDCRSSKPSFDASDSRIVAMLNILQN
jgi:hypothetical protein